MKNGINGKNKDGETALMIAAPKGDLAEVQSLLDEGADPCAEDSHGMTARMRAKNRGYNDIVALLLEAEERAGCVKQSNSDTKNDISQPAVVNAGSNNYSNAPFRFSVYSHPTLGYEVIKHGFSWPAFFFSWVWAFIKKLWGRGVLFLILTLVLLMLENVFIEERSAGGLLTILAAQLGVFLLFGFNGNRWRTESMERRGFSLAGGSMATTRDAAVAEISNQKRHANPTDLRIIQTDIEGKSNAALDSKVVETDLELEDDAIYETIAIELESGRMNRALWTKALAISEGDVDKQKAIYIKLRVSKIKNERAQA